MTSNSFQALTNHVVREALHRRNSSHQPVDPNEKQKAPTYTDGAKKDGKKIIGYKICDVSNNVLKDTISSLKTAPTSSNTTQSTVLSKDKLPAKQIPSNKKI